MHVIAYETTRPGDLPNARIRHYIPAHSWTHQFLQLLRVHWAYVQDPAVRAINGVYFPVSPTQALAEMRMAMPGYAWYYGVQIGLDPTPARADDYKLLQNINELPYPSGWWSFESKVSPVQTINGKRRVIVSKTFANWGPKHYVIQEIGLYALNFGAIYCIARDTHLVGINMPPGTSCTIFYYIDAP